jgi:hypothetical protein
LVLAIGIVSRYGVLLDQSFGPRLSTPVWPSCGRLVAVRRQEEPTDSDKSPG